MLFAIGITSINADVIDVCDTVNLTVDNAQMVTYSTRTALSGIDTTYNYEVGVTFMNDTVTDSLTIMHYIDNSYIQPLDSSFAAIII